jgi:hypothetical protein
MFYEKTLFENAWGNLLFSVAFTKMDVFPRITASLITDSLILNLGFLWFSLNLTIWDRNMREFNKGL